MRDLNALLPDANPVSILSGNALTPDGTIAAFGSTQGATVSVVLEPIYVVGDAHPDCMVNVDDLILVILEWGENASPADVTDDGVVDVDDLIEVLIQWGDSGGAG